MPVLDTKIVKGKFKCKCNFCKKTFMKSSKQRYKFIKGKNKKTFCNINCYYKYTNKKISRICKQCNKKFNVKNKDVKKGFGNFCSHSCSATFNNKNKTNGIRISKLEKWLKTELLKIYTNLEFHFNHKDTINSELDIYIPELKLAFEINGIFHYKPIYGEKKLAKIQNNDNHKLQNCIKNKIELHIINTSQQKYFKKETSKKYLNSICKIINKKNQKPSVGKSNP